jgi:hypothetical protein
MDEEFVFDLLLLLAVVVEEFAVSAGANGFGLLVEGDE